MNILKVIGISFITALIASLVFTTFFKPVTVPPLGYNLQNLFGTLSTSGPILVDAGRSANILVSATTSGRTYGIVVNDCSSAIYLSFNDESLFDNDNRAGGLRVNANGGSYEITPNNLYTGAIRASSTADCTIFYAESI